MHTLRQDALNIGDHVGVKTELKYGTGSRFPGEFGIEDFIRPAAKLAWFIYPAEEVGLSLPGPALSAAW